MQEDWREVTGFDGYEVSSLGNVRSWRKLGRCGVGLRRESPRVLSPVVNKDGYLVVSLGRVRFLVHRLVLTTFVGPCPEGMEGCHDPDRSPSNNALSNLRWDTRKGNVDDCRRHGTISRGEPHRARMRLVAARGERHRSRTMPSSIARGEAHKNSKLDDARVSLVRFLHISHGASYSMLREWFGVSNATLHRAIHGSTWAHVAMHRSA